MKLRTAIVEDQKPDAERLEQLLKKAFGEEEILCRRFVCGDDFLKEFPGEGYQVVFLDICMEGTNGIETARQLRAADPELLIVFVTSSPDFLVCNRGVIINMSKVLRFDGECIEMLDGARLPVRQKDKKSLLAQFTQYQFRNMQRQM